MIFNRDQQVADFGIAGASDQIRGPFTTARELSALVILSRQK